MPRPRKSLFPLALALVTTPVALAGQVNIEALRASGLPPGPSGSLTANLAIRTGNVDFIELDFDARHNHRSAATTTLIVADGGIGLLGRSRFASSGLLHVRRTLRLSRWLRPEWYGQINYDRPLLLRFRALGGAGVRSSLSSGPWGEVGAGAALMLEHERLTLPDSAVHAPRTTALRNSTFLTVRAGVEDRFVVTSTTYVQPDVRNPGDVRVLENVRLASAITGELALTVTFDLRFDSDPPDGIAGMDTALQAGVTYSY